MSAPAPMPFRAIQSHAYLVVNLKPAADGGPLPTFYSFDIYSAPAGALTSNGLIPADILSVKGENFADAKAKLIEYLRAVPSMWKIYGPWVDPSFEAHMTRLDLCNARDKAASNKSAPDKECAL